MLEKKDQGFQRMAVQVCQKDNHLLYLIEVTIYAMVFFTKDFILRPFAQRFVATCEAQVSRAKSPPVPVGSLKGVKMLAIATDKIWRLGTR